MTIVGLTSGCFDLVHFGHLHYLQRCRDFCDHLIVGVDSDDLVALVKGKGRPIIPEHERVELIRSLSCVGLAFILYEPQHLHAMSINSGVHKVFKHEGYKKVHPLFGVDNTKAELVIVPDVKGMVSTTAIIERVRQSFARTGAA